VIYNCSVLCPDKSCSHGGKCNLTSHSCSCLTNFAGAYCDDCATGFSGTLCANAINYCQPNPCKNAGICSRTGALLNEGYTCACPAGYTGKNCTQDINECASNPCQHGSTCFNVPGTFSCNCGQDLGYRGVFCEEPLCGDKIVREGESCDDKNLDDGDGCSHTCSVEKGFFCPPYLYESDKSRGGLCQNTTLFNATFVFQQIGGNISNVSAFCAAVDETLGEVLQNITGIQLLAHARALNGISCTSQAPLLPPTNATGNSSATQTRRRGTPSSPPAPPSPPPALTLQLYVRLELLPWNTSDLNATLFSNETWLAILSNLTAANGEVFYDIDNLSITAGGVDPDQLGSTVPAASTSDFPILIIAAGAGGGLVVLSLLLVLLLTKVRLFPVLITSPKPRN
jgi:cysteine-rich repeat protein